ncbi:MAG TPA: SH3 domain-containing protein, partial [Chitinophagaceae bacterium]
MALQTKYGELIQAARTVGITGLQVREQNNVLYIDGQAPSESAKKQLWDIYQRLDPDFRSADLVLNVNVPATASQQQEYVVVSGDN